MGLHDTGVLALKNLRHRGIRTWLTLLGIVMGIAALVALLALGQGLQEAITGQFAALSTDRLVVTNAETGFGPPGSTAVRKLNEQDIRVIERVPGVALVVPRVISVVRVTMNRITHFEFAGSLPREQEAFDYFITTFQLKAAEGRLMQASDRGTVMLGHTFTTDERYEKELRVGSRLLINGKEFKVAGILEPLGNVQFNNVLFMAEEELQAITNREDEFNLLVVQVAHGTNTEDVAESITRHLRKDRGLKEGQEDFAVETPLRVLSSVTTIISAINAVVAGIAALALLVGTVGVANTLFTSVLERTHEIGAMKALGALNKDIALLFVAEAAIVGATGGIVGVAVGTGLAFAAAFAANAVLSTTLFRVHLSLSVMLLAIILATLLGMIAGVVPAMRAARLHPVEALRT